MTEKARNLNKPEPGYFKMRLVRGGPWVPARIRRVCQCTVNGGDEERDHDWQESCDRNPPLSADINGEEADVELATRVLDQVKRVGEVGRTVGKAELRDIVRWCRRAPHPEASTAVAGPR